MDEVNAEIAALIALHAGLERQGPGDADFTRSILRSLPEFAQRPRLADLGCGSGGGALVLAEWFGVPVRAVDFSRGFLDDLVRRAKLKSLDHLIEPVQADMGALGWPAASLDLLWSEGAAYHLTFSGALSAWRPLLAQGGLAVISELSWFTDSPPKAARDFWGEGYPTMGTEAVNVTHAHAAGYEVLDTRRLPSQAWWDNYYGPLQDRMAAMGEVDDPVMRAVFEGTRVEMKLFREHSDAYGYTFYVMRAV